MVTIDFEQLPLLYRYNYISLSSKTDNINDILLGKWYICNKHIKEEDNKTNIVIFDKEYITTFEECNDHPSRYKWSIDKNDDSENPHQFSVKLNVNSNRFHKFHPTIIYVDENIILTNYKTNKYLFGEVLIKEEAKSFLKSSDDVLLYFSNIQNHWEKERIKMRNEILGSDSKGYMHYLSLVFTVLFVGTLILSLIFFYYNTTIACYGLISSLSIFIIFGLIRSWAIKKDLIKYGKKHPENYRLAKITSPNLKYSRISPL